MFIESFWLRVILLFAILSGIALIDFLIQKKRAKKWKEYLFIFTMGFIFSVIGSIHDQITVTISPEYLHKKHKTLVPKISKVLLKMEQDGTIKKLNRYVVKKLLK